MTLINSNMAASITRLAISGLKSFSCSPAFLTVDFSISTIRNGCFSCCTKLSKKPYCTNKTDEETTLEDLLLTPDSVTIEENKTPFNVLDDPEEQPLVPCAGKKLRWRKIMRNHKSKAQFDVAKMEEMLSNLEKEMPLSEDKPVKLELNPFTPERKKCFLCKYKIPITYKNPRLLSQFISPSTGEIFNRVKTGLCDHMHDHISKEIRRSRRAGYMPFLHKKLEYMDDPTSYDIFGKK